MIIPFTAFCEKNTGIVDMAVYPSARSISANIVTSKVSKCCAFGARPRTIGVTITKTLILAAVHRRRIVLSNSLPRMILPLGIPSLGQCDPQQIQ